MADINLGWDVEGILTPKESVEAMLRVIADKTPEQSGTFWTWDGRVSHAPPSFPSLNSFIYLFIALLPPPPLSPSPHLPDLLPLRPRKEIELVKKEEKADCGRFCLLYYTGASMVMTTIYMSPNRFAPFSPNIRFRNIPAVVVVAAAAECWRNKLKRTRHSISDRSVICIVSWNRARNHHHLLLIMTPQKRVTKGHLKRGKGERGARLHH
jgi:hypothetical protein